MLGGGGQTGEGFDLTVSDEEEKEGWVRSTHSNRAGASRKRLAGLHPRGV